MEINQEIKIAGKAIEWCKSRISYIESTFKGEEGIIEDALVEELKACIYILECLIESEVEINKEEEKEVKLRYGGNN